MLTRTEAEEAGQKEAARVGANSLAEFSATSADVLQQRMTPGGSLVIDGWYVRKMCRLPSRQDGRTAPTC
jgi:hypothetical protein